jgi:hypothetical protein
MQTMQTTTTPANRTPAEHAYIMAQEQAHDLLRQLHVALDGHRDCAAHEVITAAHVTDITEVTRQLRQILTQLA